MFNRRIRIFSSLLIAFIIVNIYSNLTEIKTLVSSLKFPTISLTKPDDNNLAMEQFNKRDNSFVLPTVNQIASLPTTVPPITISNQITPTHTVYPTNKIIPTTKIPTSIPKPTKTPKPTKVPPLPPINSDTRPGTSLAGVFQEVSKRACIPAALLMAFQTEESGAFFSKNNSPSIIKIYNTYGWWETGAGDPCFGLGYHTQTGIVPQDSVNAGTRCQNAIPSGDDQGIMGVLQISQFEQDATRKYTKITLPNNIDRRVLFDNALIFAIATKNRIGDAPKNCDDWPDDVIRTAAEKHYGSCGDNYCSDVLKYYKQYR